MQEIEIIHFIRKKLYLCRDYRSARMKEGTPISRPEKYPQYVRAIRRSQRKYSVVARFYLRIVWLFSVLFLMEATIFLISGPFHFLIEHLLFVFIFAISFALFISFVSKGSLVEAVYVDYKKMEIRVLRYDIMKRPIRDVISFGDFSWDVLNGGRGPDRLRMFRPDGKRIVVCEGVLGWTFDDFQHLRSALSKVAEQSDWWEKGL